MRWKALLGVVVVVAIIGLLYTTDAGRNYVDLLTNKVGSFITNFPISGEQPGKEFNMSLTTNKESFFEQTYKVEKAYLRVSGICQSTMTIGDVVVSRGEKSCVVELEDLQGQFEYSAGGVVRVDGKVSLVAVDDNSYVSTDGELSVKLEVIPMEELLLTGLSQKSITLDSVTGSIERLDDEGAIKSREELKNEKLTIISFIGQLKLEDQSILLRGLTASVKGETFSW